MAAAASAAAFGLRRWKRGAIDRGPRRQHPIAGGGRSCPGDGIQRQAVGAWVSGQEGRRRTDMLKNPDHLSFVVRDLEAAKSFFALLGFEQNIVAVISGKTFADYMGVPGIEADHVTFVLKGCTPHFEVQLLHYRHPDPLPEPHIRDLNHVGFNHLCFAVDDIDAEVARLKAAGVKFRNEILDYHQRKIVFLEGPEGVTLELAQWDRPA
jgi:catechol 2,3-dioxygenase-like lactoylglutathione lyase family enzyme